MRSVFRYRFFTVLSAGIASIRYSFFPRKIEHGDRKILRKYFPYYARMQPKFKREFERKLERILTRKQFYGRGGIDEVTQEMELLIGATLTMVVFGWKRVHLPNFNKILVYPNAYYSTINKTYHRGEVNPKLGVIVVSWRCFLEGLLDESDGVNLGIHEIAHALKLENVIRENNEYCFLDARSRAQFNQLMRKEMERMREGQLSPFREAALINEDEFFAVALEIFFESPEILKAQRPEFYTIMVQLMQQDPLVVSPKANLEDQAS
ncbi:zinc-dependent peptidase [Algoriphagus namhaensis]